MQEVDDPQSHGEPDRRCFRDDFFALYVFGEDDDITAFQLCYDRFDDEHAFTWMEGRAHHHRVDAPGSEAGELPVRPVRESGTVFPVHRIMERFRAASENLPDAVRALVLRVLQEHAD